MPKRQKKIDEKSIGDQDLLTIFLNGKKKFLQSTNLKIVAGLNGGLNLLIKHEDEWKLYCTRGMIESSIGAKRAILLINPAVASGHILQATFAGFDSQSIYWVKGFVPLDFEKAKSIYAKANSPLLHMDES